MGSIPHTDWVLAEVLKMLLKVEGQKETLMKTTLQFWALGRCKSVNGMVDQVREKEERVTTA